MELTLDDMQRLRPLLENAMAEVDASAEPGAMIQPDSVESAMSLMASYDWARGLLQRMEAAEANGDR